MNPQEAIDRLRELVRKSIGVRRSKYARPDSEEKEPHVLISKLLGASEQLISVEPFDFVQELQNADLMISKLAWMVFDPPPEEEPETLRAAILGILSRWERAFLGSREKFPQVASALSGPVGSAYSSKTPNEQHKTVTLFNAGSNFVPGTLGSELDERLILSVDAGTAPKKEIAGVLAEISRIYRRMGGSGITFRFEDATIKEEELV